MLERQTREYTPFEIYARALQVLTADLEPEHGRVGAVGVHGSTHCSRRTSGRATTDSSSRAKQWNGGFLTDGVGLGKTFVGLMLAEYYAVRERRNVLIMATKTGQDAVWKPEISAIPT